MNTRKVLFTDGEGPIVTNDFALDVTSTIDKNLFLLLSAYDDYLSVHGPDEYQAGDTLALIIPLFISHGVTDAKMKKIAQHARLTPGVVQCVRKLRHDEWNIRIISTAYTYLWETVGAHLNIPHMDIASTDLQLDKLHRQFSTKKIMNVITETEKDIKSMTPSCLRMLNSEGTNSSTIDLFMNNESCIFLRKRLDRFFWKDLPDAGLEILSAIHVIGGKRKVEAAERFARQLKVTLKDVIYIGDSITDVELFQAINRAGGLSIAINGNHYALEAAKVAVSTPNMEFLIPLLNAWIKGGNDAVSSFIQKQSKHSDAHFVRVNPQNKSLFNSLVARHTKMRKIIRADAAVLG
ncbi:MAG TPA: HAD hydrolase family protein [Patescibacteria group bacterium]|nr:HAD hydrolase family protein [Patescibacteria group bacterium]